MTSSELAIEDMDPQLAPRQLQWVDPAKINLIYGGEDPRAMMLRAGDTLPGDWDLEVSDTPFDETVTYRGIADRQQGKEWEDTIYFPFAQRRAKFALEKGRITEDQVEAAVLDRLRETDELYESIKTDGYQTQEELEVDKLPNEIRVAIRRDGRYLFIDGRHRLAVARLLGLERVPVFVVARHPEWDAFRNFIVSFIQHEKRGGRVYQQIDHPDLRDLPAAHTNDRLPMLLGALDGYDPAGKQLLDIGAHWGHMTQQMEGLGFECTGIEAQDESAEIAERLRVATESRFTIVHGNIFELPDVERFNVVLALNIFHHFLKTREKYEQLLDLLERLNPDLMLFEAHKPNSRAMADAYINYAPDDFAEFVADKVGLSQVESLGRAADRRSLFKLSR